MKPSRAYLAAIEASKEIHKAGKSFTGRFLRSHAPFIREIIQRLDCKTVLDYGCGRGEQYDWVIPSIGQTIEEWWGVKATRYDPAYPPFAQEPVGKFDMVICTQVLGSIPVSDLPWVIDRLYSLSRKALYVSERLGDARKIVGDNALRPTGFSVSQWRKALTRDQAVEVTLATREINAKGEKITKHFRRVDKVWRAVRWPDGVRFMNHKWTPE